MILNRSGHDFRRAGAVLIHQNDERVFRIIVSRPRLIVLDRSARLTSGLQDKFILLEESLSDLNGFLKEAAGIPAKIEDESFQFGGIHLLQSFLKFFAGGLR